MRKCDRRRPLCLAVGTTAPYLQEQLPGPFGYLLVAPASLGGIALGRSQDREEGQGPHPRSPRDWHHQHHAHPPQSAALHEGFMGGTDRVPVDTLGSNLLAPTSLQRRSSVSSMPRMSGPSPTNASTSDPNKMRLTSRLDQLARLK